MNFKYGWLAIALTFGVALASTSNATILARSSTIIKTLNTSDGTYGGCMAQLANSFGPGCSNWASFACGGELSQPKDLAFRMFDSAQMAYALGRTVKIWVDTDRKVNGQCVAHRIDVNPAAP